MMKSGLSDEITESILIFTALFLPGYLAQDTGFDPSILYEPVYHTGYLVAILPQIGLIWYLIARRDNNSWYGLDRPRASDLLHIVALVAGLLLVAIVVGLVQSGGAEAPAQRPRLHVEQIVLIVLTAISTGYREELYFRSHLYRALIRQGARRPAAAVLGSMVFALGHTYQGAYALIGALAMGLLLQLHFERFGKLHAIAVGHGMYNAIIMLAGNFAG